MPGETSSNPPTLEDCSCKPHLWLQCLGATCRMLTGQLAKGSRSQHSFQVSPGGCGHQKLVLGQPEPALLEVFWLCLGLMLKTVQSRNEKGEPTLTPPRDQILLFQSTHFGGREGGRGPSCYLRPVRLKHSQRH